MADTYTDPEGTERQVEEGFTGIRPNIGAGHARAIYIDGKIVAFDYNTLPGTQDATAEFGPQSDAYHNPLCTVAGIAGGVPGDSSLYNYVIGDEYGKPSGGKATEQSGTAGVAEAKLERIAKILASS